MLVDCVRREFVQPRRITRDCLIEQRTSALEHRRLTLVKRLSHVGVGRCVVRARDDADDALRLMEWPLAVRPLLEAEVEHSRRVVAGLERTGSHQLRQSRFHGDALGVELAQRRRQRIPRGRGGDCFDRVDGKVPLERSLATSR